MFAEQSKTPTHLINAICMKLSLPAINESNLDLERKRRDLSEGDNEEAASMSFLLAASMSFHLSSKRSANLLRT